MNDYFNVSFKGRLFGNGKCAKLEAKSNDKDDWRLNNLVDVLRLLEPFWELGYAQARDAYGRLRDAMKQMLEKERELADIHSQLNSPCHVYLSSRQQENLIAREKELRKELTQVFPEPAKVDPVK